MRIPKKALKVGRVLSDEGDRVILEIGKTDEASFSLEHFELAGSSKPARFYTLVFMRVDDEGTLSIWEPFE